MEKSETTSALYTALSVAQGAFIAGSKDSKNPHYNSRFMSLHALMDVVREPLAKNGLALLQMTELAPAGFSVAKETLADGTIAETSTPMDSRWVLRTMLVHKSGEFISFCYPLSPGGQTAQNIGAAVTYARRYSAAALLSIVADEDLDGEDIGDPPAYSKNPKDWVSPNKASK